MSNDQQTTTNSPLPAPGSPPPPGRPRALDDAKRREVCALVSAGCGLELAARHVGCNSSTVRREARRNPDFRKQLRLARRECELAPLQAMHKACKRHWRAAAWLLERTRAERFAKIAPQTITLDQFKEYNHQIHCLIRREMTNDFVWLRIFHTFSQVRDHFTNAITARRNPLPFPDSVTRLNERPGSPYDEELRDAKEAIERARQTKGSGNE